MSEKPTPRPDQIADLAYFINNPKACLLHDPGVGKTITAALYTQYVFEAKGWKTVWTQPMSILKKNRDELLRFTNFQPEDIVIVQGTPEKRKALMEGPGKVWLFTGTGWSNEWPILINAHPDVKCNLLDEFHLYYAGHKSARTQSWYESCRYMKAVIPMSGTLIKGRLSSVYPALHVIAPHFYGSYESFMIQHALVDEYGTVIGWQNHEKLKNVLGIISIRRSFESIYGNQDPVIQFEYCEMTKEVQIAYDKLEATALIELEDSFIECNTPGLMALRIRQLMAHPETLGAVKPGHETGKDAQMKLDIENALASGERLAIFSPLTAEQVRIVAMIEKLGGKVGLINGTVSGPKRQQVNDDFVAGRLQFVVGSAATCGIGFNWEFLNMILFASLDYGDDTLTQAFKRGIRGARAHPLLVKIFQYRNRVEARILKIVQAKMADYRQVDETKAEVFKEAKKAVKKSGKLSMEDMMKN